MENTIKILLVEDMPTDVELAQREISKSLTCTFLCVDTKEEFLKALISFEPDLIISDYQMPVFDGITALKLAIEHTPETPVIILTAATNEDTAVACMKAGAKDYVIKEHIKRLGQAVLHALEEKKKYEERKQVDLLLRKTEEKLHELADNLSSALFVYELDEKNISYLSPGFEKIWKITREEIQNNPELLLEMIYDKDRKFIESSVFNFMQETSFSFDIQFRITNGHNEIKWIKTKASPIYNENGKRVRIIGVSDDITERKQAEEALVESEARIRAIIEASKDAIVVSDKDGLITVFNSSAEKMFGHKADKVLEQPVNFLIPESYQEQQTRDVRSFFTTGKPDNVIGKTVEILARRANGERFPVEMSVARGGSGNRVFVLSIIRDITERKKAEDELSHLRNYLANIINSMPSILIGVDPDVIVTQWNNEAQRATGVAADKAIDKPLEEVFPRLASEMERVREAMRSGMTMYDPKRVRKEENDIRYDDITIFPLTDNSIEGAVIRVDDVTEQIRVQEMIVQSEKMLSVGGLAAGMAHEINNPLSGIMQTAEVLTTRLSNLGIPANIKAAKEAGTTMEAIQSFSEKRKIIEMLGRIRESGNRAADIVSNMLSFARKSNHAWSSENPADLLDKCVDLAGADFNLKKKYDFRQIRIEREYDKELPLIMCESGKLQQVLLNILRNGAEALQEESENRRKEAPRFILRLIHEREKDMVRIEIEDNGPGMDEDTRKRVFEPFFSTKPPDRGTGLGLSVSYFIITENHNGEMSVETTPGEGAKFIITLPVKRKHE